MTAGCAPDQDKFAGNVIQQIGSDTNSCGLVSIAKRAVCSFKFKLNGRIGQGWDYPLRGLSKYCRFAFYRIALPGQTGSSGNAIES